MVAARRVLIVEDEHVVQLHLRMVLQDLGYEVTGVASSAAEALESARAAQPHLVLMDVRLSGSPDGIEAARQLRAHHDLQVVFLTAYADETTVSRAEQIGPAGYLVKPFSKPQLRATLSTAFARQEGAAPVRRAPGGPPERRPFGEGTRMVIYSHDTLGLGHLQRNLNLSWALATRFQGLSILLVTGSSALQHYPLPPGVDTVKLPSVRKVAAQRYESRSLRMGDDEVLRMRSNLFLRSIQGFDPHVLLIDHAPVGMGGEALPALEWLQRHRPECRKIIGLRDVIDSPGNVARSWSQQRIWEVLEELYDDVLVYGSPEVYDTASVYSFSTPLKAKTIYCGYVSRPQPADGESPLEPAPRLGRPLVVVTIGGGDGAGEEVLGGWLRMVEAHRSKVDFESLLLTGPFLDPGLADRFRRESRGLPAGLKGFVPSTRPYLERADLLVCTGGYNTMVEAASFADRALIIPRRMHRDEQLIRARRFAELGLVSVCDPAEATPDRLFEQAHTLLENPRRPLAEARARRALPLDGAQRFADHCSRLEVVH